MGLTFNIEPLVGAIPLRFNSSRLEVHQLLGPPRKSSPWGRGGAIEYWRIPHMNVAYNSDEIVQHVCFSPGDSELSVCGIQIWTLDDQPDPNPQLLLHDPSPVDVVGFLIFPRLGISTGGYHDGDDAQRGLIAFPAGAWDEVLKDAKPANLARYR